MEFGVGIECTFIVNEKPGMRRLEEFELMRHYDRWKQDLDLVARLRSGDTHVTKLRWCFPWYRAESAPGKFDFDWCDRVVDYAQSLQLDLVPDIVHYGTPDWLEGAYLHRDYPARVAAFAAACAERYKGKIRYYTPFNEPGIACMFACERGEWPPYGGGEEAYAKAMVQIADGMAQTTRAIKQIDPSAECWSVEAMNNYRKALDDGARPEARRRLLRDLAAWDLVHGRVDSSHDSWKWLTSNGVAAADLERLLGEPVKMDVLGLNFYPWQSKTLKSNGSKLEEEFDLTGKLLLDLIRDSHQHTGAQRLWVTETSAHGGGGARSSAMKPIKETDRRSAWMDGTLEAAAQARRDGLPLEGYIQFPLFSMVDWAYRLDPDNAPPEDYFLNLGMIEVNPKTYDRVWSPVADRFLQHLASFEKPVKTR